MSKEKALEGNTAAGVTAARLAALPSEKRAAIVRTFGDREWDEVIYQWPAWARPSQLPPPGQWRVWLVMAGRGFGKTRTGAEWVRAEVESGRRSRIALVGRTEHEARTVLVEGPSGILAVSPPWFRPLYEPSKGQLTWPNGAVAFTYSGQKAEQLRGPEHDGAWGDEAAVWEQPQTLDMLLMGTRVGADPRYVITTTPRPVPHVRALLDAPDTVVTRGTIYDNRANLAADYLQSLTRQYEGTRLGRQELLAELLEDNPDALWQRDAIDKARRERAPLNLERVVVAVDPAVTTGEDACETGIIVAGIMKVGEEAHAYVLEDCSLRGTPFTWAKAAVDAYHRHHADRIVAEVNNGGEMVAHTLRTVDRTVSYKAVTASHGKHTRAEPVAALYEQGRVHHVGAMPQLEDQMCCWTPGERSPDRMDALVWALTELVLLGKSRQLITW